VNVTGLPEVAVTNPEERPFVRGADAVEARPASDDSNKIASIATTIAERAIGRDEIPAVQRRANDIECGMKTTYLQLEENARMAAVQKTRVGD
jgi:hypothetical protein